MKLCGTCGTENDDTRVFCLNCAQRLSSPIPGSAPGLPGNFTGTPGASAPKISAPQSPQSRPKPRQAGARFSTKVFSLLVVLALAAAVLATYLILEPPPIAPPALPAASAEDSARLVNFLRAASKSPGGAWQGDEDAINRLLAAKVRLRPLENPLGIDLVLQGCHIALREQRIDLFMRLAVFDRPVCLRLALAPASKDGKAGLRVVASELGRLRIPGPLAEFLLPLWRPCLQPLEPILALASGAKTVEAMPKRLVVRWPDASSR